MIITTSEAQTGKFMFGAGVNSNAGVIGQITLDEQNFDWQRLPSSWEDFRNGQAFRGAGQKFRLEAAPGTVGVARTCSTSPNRICSTRRSATA